MTILLFLAVLYYCLAVVWHIGKLQREMVGILTRHTRELADALPASHENAVLLQRLTGEMRTHMASMEQRSWWWNWWTWRARTKSLTQGG